jgi:hypothetical protein
MDTMTITLHPEVGSSSYLDNSIAIAIIVTINARELPDILDVDEFFKAMQKSGRFPLFTCGCDHFGCSGYYIDVVCTATAWVLRNRYHPHNEQLMETFEYHIPWQQVRTAAQEIVNYLQALHVQYPHHEITAGVVGLNLASHIADYDEILSSLP